MNDSQNREQVIRYVRGNGRRLSEVSDAFRDDAEVVASAILSSEFGGVGVLQYASPRLQRDERLFKLAAIVPNLHSLVMEIQQMDIPWKEKEKYLRQIEDRKDSIIQEYFVAERVSSVVVEQEKTQSRELVTPPADYYLDQIQFSDEVKSIIERGVLGTSLNYPNSDSISALGSGVYDCLCQYCRKPYDGEKEFDFDSLSEFISRNSTVYGIPLRNQIETYYRSHPKTTIFCEYGHDREVYDVELPTNMLFSIDLLRLSLSKANPLDDRQQKILGFLTTLDFYLAANAFAMRNNEDITVSFQNECRLRELFETISCEDIQTVLHDYFDTLDVVDVFKDTSIVIEEVTDTAREVISNANGMSLKDSFHATLLNGRIDIASHKGYEDPLDTQDDAVGSVVVDDTHFINIVADGVGGARDGAIGSKILVEKLSAWYRSLPRECLDDTNLLSRMLDDKVREISFMLSQNYGNQAQTTLVVALTAGENTIIANCGDSTAYGYDGGTDQLVELSTLDSLSYGMSYEAARHNPDNNRITDAIGYSGYSGLHVRVISNQGQRIILSSDGVTDLISEQHYKEMFRNHKGADYIVEKAKDHPDVYGNMKSVDNISAIVIDLPGREYGFRRGH